MFFVVQIAKAGWWFNCDFIRQISDPGESHSPRVMGTRMNALVVDDDASIRKIVAKLLTKGGFDVVGEAADGAQALEIAARLLPDVITLDDSMPGMSGLAVLPQLRKTLPNAVIVMLSMHMQYEEHARRGGADAYILKICAVDELIPAIRSALAVSACLFPA